MSRASDPPIALDLAEQREAASIAVNLQINPAAIERVAAELVALRSVVRQARRMRYLANCAPVRALMDRLPRRL